MRRVFQSAGELSSLNMEVYQLEPGDFEAVVETEQLETGMHVQAYCNRTTLAVRHHQIHGVAAMCSPHPISFQGRRISANQLIMVVPEKFTVIVAPAATQSVFAFNRPPYPWLPDGIRVYPTTYFPVSLLRQMVLYPNKREMLGKQLVMSLENIKDTFSTVSSNKELAFVNMIQYIRAILPERPSLKRLESYCNVHRNTIQRLCKENCQLTFDELWRRLFFNFMRHLLFPTDSPQASTEVVEKTFLDFGQPDLIPEFYIFFALPEQS